MTVTVKMLVDRLKLKVVYGNKDLLAKAITTADISRPGLEMTGYFDYYSPERLQLVGMKEWSYLKTMTDDNRYSVFTNMFKAETPAVIVARGLEVPEEMLRAAKENGVAFFKAVAEHHHFQVICLGTSMHSWRNVPVFTVFWLISTAWVFSSRVTLVLVRVKQGSS